MAYQPDLVDTRESPLLKVLALLLAKGAEAVYHDPHVPPLEFDGWRLESVAPDERTLGEGDCLMVTTRYHGYRWGWIAAHSRLIVDTHNAPKGVADSAARTVRL